MLDSNFMGRVKAEITATRKWLDANKDTIVEASKLQMKEKKAAAAQSNTANSSTPAAGSPVAQQLSYLKTMAATLPEGPQKTDLLAKIAQLEQWAAASGAAGTASNTTTGTNTAANPFAALLGQQAQGVANPFAALFGSQQGQPPINPFTALFGGFQGGPTQGNPFNPYGYQSSQVGAGGYPMQAVMAQWLQGMFAQQQQPPYR